MSYHFRVTLSIIIGIVLVGVAVFIFYIQSGKIKISADELQTTSSEQVVTDVIFKPATSSSLPEGWRIGSCTDGGSFYGDVPTGYTAAGIVCDGNSHLNYTLWAKKQPLSQTTEVVTDITYTSRYCPDATSENNCPITSVGGNLTLRGTVWDGTSKINHAIWIKKENKDVVAARSGSIITDVNYKYAQSSTFGEGGWRVQDCLDGRDTYYGDNGTWPTGYTAAGIVCDGTSHINFTLWKNLKTLIPTPTPTSPSTTTTPAPITTTTTPSPTPTTTTTTTAPTIPNPPTALNAVPDPNDYAKANLSWTTSTSSFADGYAFKRSTTQNPEPVELIGGVVGGTKTSGIIEGLSCNTTYYVWVQAYNNQDPPLTGAYYSTSAGPVSFTTIACPSSPTPDIQKPSTPGTVNSSSVTSDGATLSWTASTDNVGVTGYDIYNADNGQLVGTTNDTKVSLRGLACNTTYKYYVKAHDSAGNQSEKSNTVEIKTGACSTSGGTTGDTSKENIISKTTKLVSTGASLWLNILIALLLTAGISYFLVWRKRSQE